MYFIMEEEFKLESNSNSCGYSALFLINESNESEAKRRLIFLIKIKPTTF